ncbi:MAG: sugar phosphate isomerase/epimerase family protein [Phycisphaerae bacterium]
MKHQNSSPMLPLLAVEPLALDLRAAAQSAKTWGYGGLAIGIGHPELHHKDFGATARRHFRHLLARLGLTLGVLRVGAGKAGAFNSATSQKLLDDALAACDLAHSLQTPLISVYIGEPTDDQTTTGDVMEICHTLAVHADCTGVVVALSCGRTAWLLKVLSDIEAPSLAANLDSVRIVAAGGSPPEAAAILAGRIALWTCADAIRSGLTLQSAPLGSGHAAGQQVLHILREQDYTGPVVVDVRDLPQPPQAAEYAYTQLKHWMLT